MENNATFPFSLIPYALCLVFTFNSLAQGVGINTTGTDAVSSAMLDVSSTEAPYQGLLIPRMTQTQRNTIVDPAFGLQIFNTTTGCFNFYTGASWKQICGDCDFNVPIPGNNGPICEGSTLNLTATTILDATYQWTGPNGFTSALQNPSVVNATDAASGAYSVTATKSGCTCQPQSTVVTVNTTPVTPSTNNTGPVCVGATLNLTASTIAGATYSWTGPNIYTSNVQNPNIANTQLTNAGTYNVIATVNGCASEAGTTNVTVNSLNGTGGSITYTDDSGLNPRSSSPYSGGYTIHTFTTSGTFTTTCSGNVGILIVAGGGGGGGSYYAGGGGAGGLIYNSAFAVTPQTYTVTIGNGGAGGGIGADGTNGYNSVFSSLTAYGGGGGGSYPGKPGLTGGSGGGAGGLQSSSQVGGTAPYGQGYAGGNTTSPNSTIGSYGAGAGGGGAGGVGASIGGAYTFGANGGIGLSYSISGIATYYSGGGGGGAGWNSGCDGGIGGNGGGGNGANSRGVAATIGTVNTGGGGGGGQYLDGGGDQTGKAGGSGIVIIRYPN